MLWMQPRRIGRETRATTWDDMNPENSPAKFVDSRHGQCDEEQSVGEDLVSCHEALYFHAFDLESCCLMLKGIEIFPPK